MDVYALQSLQSDRGLLDPSSQLIECARWEDLDPLEFERFRRSVRERRGRSDESLLELPDLELAMSLGVVDANGTVRGVKLAALLLFEKEDALFRHVPTHEVAFQAMRALDVEINDFFRWPLLRVTEEIEARIRARNREPELLVGVLRVGVPDYPERALREAPANALIHRDYQRLGATHFNAGLVEARDQTGGMMWRLSAGAERVLGGSPEIEQEKVVAQFVEQHRRITRGEAAGLCGLSPDQAYRLLGRLVEDGQLVRRRAKKGAWYERRG
jgi:predicted HTH transcriptional regulator